MDFVLLPDNVAAHDSIPDLGGIDYDNKGFQGYPERQGWHLKAIRSGDVASACDKWGDWAVSVLGSLASDDEYTVEEIKRVVGAFAQRWIIFGILQVALRRPVLKGELVKTCTTTASDGTVSSVDCITLQRVFTEFLGKETQIKQDLAWAMDLYQCLREAAGVLADVGLRGAKLGVYLMPSSIHFALSVFVDTIDFSFRRPDKMSLTERVFPGRSMAFEQSLMQRHGWCGNVVKRILMTLGHEGLYYASLLPKFETGKSHKACSEDTCVASNITDNTYEVLHTSKFCKCLARECDHKQSGCGCACLRVHDRDLAMAHEEGGFPLVKVERNTLKVVRYQPETAYIAISHVWSDGRGNPSANALPICQLELIGHYIKELTGAKISLFWMDTLCVPLKEPLRNTAIMRMAKIYESASQVLVLSADLLSNHLPSTPDEALFRIFCSQWSARLWTMQEATLATELVFQFADRVASRDSLSMLMAMAAVINLDGRSRQFGTRANLALQDIRSITRPGEGDDENFPVVRFWSSLRFRSTSRLSDVAICGAILLGHGLETVLSASKDLKMQAFWSCLETVPASVLWSNGPRFKTDGLRWAPSNLLNPKTATWTDGNAPAAKPTRDGLVVTDVKAVLLENVPLPGKENIILRYFLPGEQQHFVCLKTVDVGNDTWADMQQFWNGRCVLLLGPINEGRWDGFGALTLPTDPVLDGQQGEDLCKQPIAARYLAQVSVLVQSTLSTDDTITVNDGNDAFRSSIPINLNIVLDIAQARRIDSSQQWCIF